ncbi:hypothetical protein LR48_Vigan10s000700 [Vigna angularis]|uniref:Uncharacterized protein n=1 Tax=Phaseolus angularis TaxID=3914 RepID=A0A0L9T2T3_PHAAN|nr:hypothetical protein LR48_Vigan10s000700 [Vigna angularis]
MKRARVNNNLRAHPPKPITTLYLSRSPPCLLSFSSSTLLSFGGSFLQTKNSGCSVPVFIQAAGP